MKAVPLTPQPGSHHLPRLSSAQYQGFAAVQWTLTLQPRLEGWLDASFHAHFRELLLHAAARDGVACPVYVLMPDHLHLLWLGLRVASDQLVAMRFLRRHLQLEFARRSTPDRKYQLQKQSHDSVLRGADRTHGAVTKSGWYILENPRRQGLIEQPRQWPYQGAVISGYPFLNPWHEDFWPAFWKLYEKLREPANLSQS